MLLTKEITSYGLNRHTFNLLKFTHKLVNYKSAKDYKCRTTMHEWQGDDAGNKQVD